MAKAKKEEAEATTAAPAEKITQREAVKQALAAGKDTPADGVIYVKDTFGMTLTNQAFSTLKSLLKNEGGTVKSTGKRGRPAGSTNAVAKATPVQKTASGVGNGNGSPAELALAVKQLVAAYGADSVKSMVGVFEG